MLEIKKSKRFFNVILLFPSSNNSAMSISVRFVLLASFSLLFSACKKDAHEEEQPAISAESDVLQSLFGDNINLESLYNYSNQPIPDYITQDNSGNEAIDNATATLGRVLFYDKQLSSNNTISCSSCHKQAFAFSDPAPRSTGVNGLTGRHSMRLINSRFSEEARFFWDERALSLEDQTTQPIQDHNEMGFSGENGDPGIAELLDRLETLEYYQELFTFAFGDPLVTEERLQLALSQFIRSIQSFDSRYDEGRALVQADNINFPSFSALENLGKQLFLAPPQFNAQGVRIGGGLGCGGCHRAPEFDIDPNSLNNGITGNPSDPGTPDFAITRSPSLRDIVGPNGTENGPFMHDAVLGDLNAVLNHYNNIILAPGNTTLDPRLRPGGNPQQLNLSLQERNAVMAFLRTLSGTGVYDDPRWSDPFLN
jgi:cytochrome c peroxidase